MPGKCSKNFNGRNHVEDLVIDGRGQYHNLKRTELKGVDWIRLAQNRGRWRVLVNTAINIRAP
jgi:hypothetical protein